MRSSSRVLCFLLLVSILSTLAAHGQSSLPSTSDTQQARDTLLAAENAMGGPQAWIAIEDSTVQGTCVPASQVGANPQPSNSFRWIFAQNEFRFEAGAEGTSTVMLSGHGKPQALDSIGTRSLTSESGALTRPYHLPGQVLATVLNDNRFRISFVGNEVSNGISTVHVQINHKLLHSDEPGSTQDWWFNSNSHLPLKVTFNVPGQEIQAYLPFTYSFLSWSAQGGLLIPNVIAESMYPDRPLQTCSISQMQVNTNPAPSTFDAQ